MTCELFATVIEEQEEIGIKVKEADLFTLQRIRLAELSYMA